MKVNINKFIEVKSLDYKDKLNDSYQKEDVDLTYIQGFNKAISLNLHIKFNEFLLKNFYKSKLDENGNTYYVTVPESRNITSDEITELFYADLKLEI